MLTVVSVPMGFVVQLCSALLALLLQSCFVAQFCKEKREGNKLLLDKIGLLDRISFG